jgi:replicative DNA helicase
MDPLKQRVPPQNLEAEMYLLGAIMIRPEVIHDIIGFFRVEYFYAQKHQIIYEQILNLLNKNEPIDAVTVSSKLREVKQLDAIGGAAYLGDLASSVSTSANSEYFAKEIRKKALLRELIKVSHKIGELGFREESELEQTLEEAEQHIYNLTQNSGTGDKHFIQIKDALEEAWKRIERMHEHSGQLRGVTTGFKDLDNMLSGWQQSDLIILAARPSVGKTSLSLDFARHASVNAKKGVAYFSLEMSKEQVIDRLVSAESRVNSWKLRTGAKLQDNEWGMLQGSLDRLSAAPLFIDDEPSITTLGLRSKLRRIIARHPIDLVIVDYLQLMNSVKSYDNMVNQVGEISKNLKAIAKEFKVPVIALSQLSRAVETRGGKPKLSDLRDSGSIEQDADVVIFIHREDRTKSAADRTEGPIEAELLIEKHRNGATGVVRLHFDDKKTTFLPIDKEFSTFSNNQIPEADFSAGKISDIDEF